MRLFLRVIQCNGWSEHPNEKATPNRNGAFEYVPLFHCPIVHGRDSHQYQYDSIFCTKCDQFPFIWIESNFSLFHFGSSSFFLKKNVAHNVFRFQFWLPLDPEKTEDFQSYSIALDRMKAERGSEKIASKHYHFQHCTRALDRMITIFIHSFWMTELFVRLTFILGAISLNFWYSQFWGTNDDDTHK